MLIKNKYYLTYCSNIFKEKKWKDLLNKLNIYIKNLKENFKNKNTNISLCISNSLANEIKDKYISKLETWLKNNDAYLSSINGFVYQTFHQKYIKDKIYYPDWTSIDRVTYTQNLINILNILIKHDHEGSISTSPISYTPWIKYRYNSYILFSASKNLTDVIKFLIQNTKKNIHIDIEPEPHCTIESSKNFIHFFNAWLLPISKKYIQKDLNITSKKIETLTKKYIRICYDICHLSVNFEKHQNAIQRLKKNNIKIGKIQVSSALTFKMPQTHIKKKDIIETLLTLKNSPFLHQTNEKDKTNIKKYRDISYALKDFHKKENNEFKIHCHMPLYLKKYKNIDTTHDETEAALKLLLDEIKIKHIEIETYTHSMISKTNQMNSIIKEYDWVINLIKKHKQKS